MKNKQTSDFGSDAKPETVVLRERTWRIELSRSEAMRFLRQHKVRSPAFLPLSWLNHGALCVRRACEHG